jgi:hypothetical protein
MLGRDIWRRLKHSTESRWRAFQILERNRYRNRISCENVLTFFVKKSNKPVVANYLLAEYTERTMNSVCKDTRDITVKFMTELHLKRHTGLQNFTSQKEK